MLPSHKLPFSFCMHGQTCARLAPQCSLGWFQFNLWLCKLTVNANNSGLYQSQSTENGRNGLSLARNAAICQVVHFPEIITVRVRNNLLEGNVLGPRKMRCQTVTTNNQSTKIETKQIESHEYIYIYSMRKKATFQLATTFCQVRITVKLMNVFGSEDLCKVHVSDFHASLFHLKQETCNSGKGGHWDHLWRCVKEFVWSRESYNNRIVWHKIFDSQYIPCLSNECSTKNEGNHSFPFTLHLMNVPSAMKST